MKKIYQIPATQVVNINGQQILAGSPGYGGNTEETSGNLSRYSGGIWDGHRNSLCDDDEDYDELLGF